jgi:hypothetical protein
MRDHATLYDRIRRLGPQFNEVRQRLLGKSKCHLSACAADFAAKYHVAAMDRLERRTFDGIVTWFCKHNVLNLLDPDDERKLSTIKPKLNDPFDENVLLLGCDVGELFGQGNDVRPWMNKMEDDMKAIDFGLDF